MTKSIIQHNEGCYICGRSGPLQMHHCLHGIRRKMADEDGLWVWLCPSCHGKLHDKGLYDEHLEIVAQVYWMQNNGTKEDFIKRYGKSYIEEE